MAFWILFLPPVLLLSLALAAASCWGIYALTKQRWVWLLTPVFLVFWLAMGMVSLTLSAWLQVKTAAPANLPPTGMYEVLEEPEAWEPQEAKEAVQDLNGSP